MALAATFRSSLHTTANSSTYTTATGAFTPASHSLMIAIVISRATDATSATSVSGNGASYSKVGTGVDISTNGHADLWVADSGASPISGEVTASGWGSNRSGAHVMVVEITGAELAAGPVAAIIQLVTNSGTATSGSVTLASASNANNRPFAAYSHGAAEVTNPRVNWTELDDGNFATPNDGGETQWRSDTFETTSTATWTTSQFWVGLAFEIQAQVTSIPIADTDTGGLVTSQVALPGAVHGGGAMNIVVFDPAVVGRIWAAGDVGGISLSTDGGDTWLPKKAGIPNRNDAGTASLWINPSNSAEIVTISGAEVNDGGTQQIYAVGGVYRTTNTGTSFSQQNTVVTGAGNGNLPDYAGGPRSAGWLQAFLTSDSKMYAASFGTGTGGSYTNQPGVYRASSPFTSWGTTPFALSGAWIRELILDPSDSTCVLVGLAYRSSTGDYGVRRVKNDGTVTTLNTGLPAQTSVECIRTCATCGKWYAACGKNGVYTSSNNGATWTAAATLPSSTSQWSSLTVQHGASFDEIAVGCSNPELFGGLGNYGSVFISLDSGASWACATADPIKITFNLRGSGEDWWVHLDSTGQNYMLGKSGHVTHMISWDPNDSNHLMLAGKSGLWDSRDKGATWRPCSVHMTDTTHQFGAVHPTNPKEAAAHGDDWTKYNTHDAFVTMHQGRPNAKTQNSGLVIDFDNVHYVSLAKSASRQILASSTPDVDTGWTVIGDSTNIDADVRWLGFCKDATNHTTLFVGTAAKIFRRFWNGSAFVWDNPTSTGSVQIAATRFAWANSNTGGVGFALTATGIHKTVDGGATWFPFATIAPFNALVQLNGIFADASGHMWASVNNTTYIFGGQVPSGNANGTNPALTFDAGSVTAIDTSQITQVSFLDYGTRNAYAVTPVVSGTGASIKKTQDFGVTWVDVTPQALRDIMVDVSWGWAQSGYLYIFTNGQGLAVLRPTATGEAETIDITAPPLFDSDAGTGSDNASVDYGRVAPPAPIPTLKSRRLRSMPTVSWTVDGVAVPMTSWRANCVANGGFDSFRGAIPAELVRRSPNHFLQEAPIVGNVGSEQYVWAGHLVGDPVITGGLAWLEATGYKDDVINASGRLLYQSRDYSLYADGGGAPFEFTPFSEDIQGEVRKSALYWKLTNGFAYQTNDAFPIAAWLPGAEITRAAADITKSGNVTDCAVRIQSFTGPSGSRTVIADESLSSGGPTSFDVTIDSPEDGIVFNVRFSANNTPSANRFIRLKNLRINGIALSDEFLTSEAAADIGMRVGYDTSHVSGAGVNVLPFDLKSGSWAREGLDYFSLLDDWRWCVWENQGRGPILDYGPWDTRVWEVHRESNATVALHALPIYNKVVVTYTSVNGSPLQVESDADPNPLARAGKDRVWTEELSDAQPDDTLALAVAETLIERLGKPRFSGNVDIVGAHLPSGLGNAYSVRAGDMINVTDWAPGEDVIQRIVEVSYTSNGVSIGVETPITAQGVIANFALENLRRKRGKSVK